MSSLPRSGSAQAQTQSIVNGIKMALAEADYKIGDFKIVYDATCDMNDASTSAGQWDAPLERDNANRAVQDPDVMVYIGPYNSGAAKISMPILNAAPLLQISPANTAVGLTKKSDQPGEPGIYYPSGKRHYVRVVGIDDVQGPAAAKFAKKLGVKRVFIIDDNEMYGKGIATEFHRACDATEIEVLGHESIDAKSTEFTTLMTKIKALKPDLIYFGGTTQSNGGQIAKDMVATGLDCKLMAPEGCMEHVFIKTAGAENLNGRCYLTFPGRIDSSDASQGESFAERYKKLYDVEPEPYAIYGYESGRAAIEAIRKAGVKDRAAIIAAAFAVEDFKGALGSWRFDANGDTSMGEFNGFVVRDGKFVFETELKREELKTTP